MIPHEYYVKVKKYFEGDAKKTWMWWTTYNPAFCTTPIDMIKRGKLHKVKLFIDNAIDENKGFYP
jgi:hypothetical protein